LTATDAAVTRPRPTAALVLRQVSLDRDDRTILDRIDWIVEPGQRWVVLGANGSGKTTLVRIASLYLHPSRGDVTVDGGTLGRVDVRRHRTRVGLVSSSFADLLRPALLALDIVMTARYAALEPWWHTYTDADRDEALALLDRVGALDLAGRTFGTLSSGERQRVQLARALMGHPALLLLDEPSAGLDLAGREDLLVRLGRLAEQDDTPATVLVTHHVDEIPPGFTHLLLLREGRVLAAGPIDETLTAANLSACFATPLELEHRHGRWWAWTQTPSAS
jgi:iron complex transport system ATP-binding protein